MLTGLPSVAPALRVARGGTVTLNVNPGAAIPAPGFQWFHGLTPRPNAGGPSLTLTNLQPLDAGDYFVVVSNSIGFAVGHVATLVVEATGLRISGSTFDAGAEDWTVEGDTVSPLPVFGVVNSTGGGYLTAQDTASGQTWYWRAGPGFRGNKSPAYGGHLTFDLKQSFTDQQYNDRDVVLVGGGMTLVFDTVENPGTNWTSYRVPLHESAGWRVTDLAGRVATRAELLHTLASLADVRIRGEFSTRQDTGNLDNVALVAPPEPVAGWLTHRRSSATLLELEWPVMGGLQLEVADAPDATIWAVLAPQSTSNGLHSATINTSSGSYFFRLKKPAP